MVEIKQNKFGGRVIDKMTQSLSDYFIENEHTEFLILFIHIGDKFIKENKEESRSMLVDIFEDPDNEISQQLIEFLKTNSADHLLDGEFYSRHFSNMAYCRAIDNFITYFKDILAEVVYKKPKVLSSKDQEKLDFILKYDNFEDLLKALSEKKIEELFYKGISDISDYFSKKLGIEIFKDEDAKKEINFFIKQRNLIVHNRGKITKEFINEFDIENYQVDQYLLLNYNLVSKINLYLGNFLIDLDIEISQKFNLDYTK